MMLEFVQLVINAATPYLVGTAALFAVLAFCSRLARSDWFAKGVVAFRRLPVLDKSFLIVAFCFFTWWGGAKPDGGDRGDDAADNEDGSGVELRQEVVPQLRDYSGPPLGETNVLAISSFSINAPSNTVTFGISWTSNYFDNLNSRYLDLFMSTNILNRRWLWLGDHLMPGNATSHVVSVSASTCDENAQLVFSNSFSRAAFFRFGADFDTDGDGLTDAYERFCTLTAPYEPDTDGDGMNDGWEIEYSGLGFTPLAPNTNGVLSADYDLDLDGLSNYQEAQIGTNPGQFDTDADGFADILELLNGSDPLDALSNLASNSTISVVFVYGDPSYTKSEKYNLKISPLVGSGPGVLPRDYSWVNGQYGQCDTNIAFLAKGWRYAIRLRHAGTNRSPEDGPDYDYILAYSNLTANAGLFFEDPDGLFGLVDVRDGGPFTGAGKVAFMSVLDMVVTKDGEVVGNNDFAYITAEPQMPNLKAAFYPEGLSGAGMIDLSIDYARNRVSQHSEYSSGSIAIGSEWVVRSAMEDAIRGGRAVFSGECLGCTFAQTNHIRGTNPSEAAVEAAIGNDPWYAKAILRHESGRQGNVRYCQFNEVGNLGPNFSDIRHCPNWGTPNGWGIGQIDPPDSYDTLWNWRTNILQVVEKMNKFRSEASNWILSQQAQQQAENPNMPLANETFNIAGYIFQEGTDRTPADACAIARYNGAKPWAIVWRNSTPSAAGFWDVNSVKTNYIWKVMEEMDE